MIETYYYGQGRVYLAPLGSINQWRWIGDVSELTANIEFEEKKRKASVRGRLVTLDRYITDMDADLSMVWHDFSQENLAILLNATQSTSRQSWTQEKFTGIKSGDILSLEHTLVCDVTIDGLTKNVDFIANETRVTIEFLKTPDVQPLIISYDYAEESSIALLNDLPKEWALRYHGINLAENGKEVFIEFYRLSISPAETLELINNSNTLAGVSTSAVLLADFSKNLSNAFGLFGRFVSAKEFKTITYNGEINYDFSHDFAY